MLFFYPSGLQRCELSTSSSNLDNTQIDNSADDDKENVTPLSADFVIKDKYDQETTEFIVGEYITFEIILTNTANEDITYQTTLPGYDISVEQNSELIWSSSTDISAPQDVTDRVIKGSEVEVIRETWSDQNDLGDLVSPGTYQVRPHLNYSVDGSEVPDPEAKEITLH